MIAHDPATPGPRPRRRWVLLVVAAVLALGLAAGIVAWAPWVPPPVLRPAGLSAGPATANSVAFRWSRPRTGPLPDRYLILSNGTVIGSAAGTATSYRQAGRTPATSYRYRVIAVRGGKRSPPSALLTVSTATPPLSQARLRGSWRVYARNVGPAQGGRNGYLAWRFSPACAAGACDVRLRGRYGSSSPVVRVKLTRHGAVYRGKTVAAARCGSGAESVPDLVTLRIRIRVTSALGEVRAWAATSWTGILAGTYHYASSAAFYCSASTFRASLHASPGVVS